MIPIELDPLTRPVALSEMLLLLAGAAFVGWLLARWIMASRVNGLRETIAERQSELDAYEAQQARAPLPDKSPAIQAIPLQHAANGGESSPLMIESVAEDLKRIEGIGPKIEGLLHADGIRTYAQLAATNPNHIAGLLNSAGSRFRIHNPETWPEQAALARDGKWNELKALKQRLVGSR